jgi:hypothetical protein
LPHPAHTVVWTIPTPIAEIIAPVTKYRSHALARGASGSSRCVRRAAHHRMAVSDAKALSAEL